MTGAHLPRGLAGAPAPARGTPVPQSLSRAAHASAKWESCWICKKWQSSGFISEQRVWLKSQLCASCWCCPRSPSQLSPSADSGGEFGLQLLVATALAQHGEGVAGRQTIRKCYQEASQAINVFLLKELEEYLGYYIY